MIFLLTKIPELKGGIIIDCIRLYTINRIIHIHVMQRHISKQCAILLDFENLVIYNATFYGNIYSS